MSTIAVVCKTGLENFLPNIVSHFKKKHNVLICYNNDKVGIERIIAQASIVWFEWANELTISILNDTNFCQKVGMHNKQVVVRVHRYELYNGMVEQLNWNQVKDVIFVSDHPLEIFTSILAARKIDIRKSLPELTPHVIPNGIDLNEFHLPAQRKKPTGKIACLGYLNARKGLQLLLHAFQYACRNNKDLSLHIAGPSQDPALKLYLQHIIMSFGFEKRIFIEDTFITDPAAWFADKQFVAAASYDESHGVGICEAMACGLKPVIHNFYGSTSIYPKKYVWTTLDQLKTMLNEKEYNPQEYYDFIQNNYSLKQQLDAIDEAILCEDRG